MAKVGDYKIKDFYQGGYSSLDPSQNISPFQSPIGTADIGMSTDARSANVVKTVSQNLSAGAKAIELNQVFPETFDSVPNEQLKEVKRMTDLLGVDITFHAPVLEPSGMAQQGGFSETNRISVENQMKQAVERAALLKPEGNIPVTFHSSAALPGFMTPKNKEPEETYVVNVETGAPNRIPINVRRYPGEEEIDIDKEVKRINEDQWKSQLTSLGYAATMGLSHLGRGFEDKIKKGKIDTLEWHAGKGYVNDSYRQLKRLYDTAYNAISKNGNNPKDKELLDDFYNRVEKGANEIEKSSDEIEKIEMMTKIIEDGLATFDKLSEPPKMFQRIDEFARDKSTETFANVALNTYEKFVKKGKKAPIICIENPPVGGAFAKGEDLKKIVEESREKFVNKLVDNGISKSEAQKQAEQLIGVTWDVGHINMLRKYGYDEKDILEQTEKIAHLTKHVHLSDNFGMEHTELPMGMGNVPIKEIMEKLGEKGYKGKKIIEAMHWWQHFSEQGKIPPLQPTLEAFGSSIYADGAGPYWNQVVGLHQGYFGGYGMMLPPVNYNTWGGGWSMASLPAELGGQMPGSQGSRISGRPME